MPSKGQQDKVGWYRITATPAYLGLVVRQLLERLSFTPSPAVFAFYRAIDMGVKYDFIRKRFIFAGLQFYSDRQYLFSTKFLLRKKEMCLQLYRVVYSEVIDQYLFSEADVC